MKIWTYFFIVILTMTPGFASDSENDDQEPRQQITTIEELDSLFEDTRIHSEPSAQTALEMYGLRPQGVDNDNNADVPLEESFLKAIPFSLNGFGVKCCLTYQDLLLISQNKGMRTEKNVFFAFLSRMPGEEDKAYPLSDCRMLADLSQDMAAYCTVLPFVSCISGGTATLKGDLSRSANDAVRAIEKTTERKALSASSVSLATGQDKKATALLAYRAAAICPMYRLYKGNEPRGVFALVSFKIEAQDRAVVIKELLPGFVGKLAKKMRKADSEGLQDFKQFKK